MYLFPKIKRKKKNLGLFSHCLAAQISCVLLRAHNAVGGIVVVSIFMIVTHFGVE